MLYNHTHDSIYLDRPIEIRYKQRYMCTYIYTAWRSITRGCCTLSDKVMSICIIIYVYALFDLFFNHIN